MKEDAILIPKKYKKCQIFGCQLRLVDGRGAQVECDKLFRSITSELLWFSFCRCLNELKTNRAQSIFVHKMSGQNRISHRVEGARLLGEDWTVIGELGELTQALPFLLLPMATEGTNVFCS